MNKSTPINQLPVTQLPMPQNTQLGNDPILDDDSAIQDILNQINASGGVGGGGGTSSAPGPNMNEQNMIQQMQYENMQKQQQQQQLLNMAAAGNMNINNLQAPQTQNLENLLVQNNMNYKSFFNMFTDDMILAGIVFVCVIVNHFIPFDKFVGKYFSLDKIPHHQLIFSALSIASLVLFIKKIAKI